MCVCAIRGNCIITTINNYMHIIIEICIYIAIDKCMLILIGNCTFNNHMSEASYPKESGISDHTSE